MFKVFGFLTKREGIAMREFVDYYETNMSRLQPRADSDRLQAQISRARRGRMPKRERGVKAPR